MLSSKSKSGFFSDVANNKNTPASKNGRLRLGKLDVDSPSLQKNTSFSTNASPNSADSKPAVSRRRTKIITTSDKYSSLLKGSEQRVQLASLQEDLRKAKKNLVFEKIEKANVLQKLSDAKKVVEVVSEKLGGALLALKKVEENFEVEKKWHKEFEDISNEHDVDVTTLVCSTDAKKRALRQADEAKKIAGIDAKKVEFQLENKSNEAALVIKKLCSQAETLKLELLRTNVAEEKLAEMEDLVEGLKIELADVKKAESDAGDFVDEWKKNCLDEVKQSENAVKESLASLTKQLEESNSILDYAESEVICLKQKAKALELEVESHEVAFKQSDHQLDLAKQEVLDVEKNVAVLKSEIRRAEEGKKPALNNEKLRSSNVKSLTQINNKLGIEIGISRENSEKSKKEMKGLASALHEVSMEARDLQERLLIKQAEFETTTSELGKLQLVLKITQETFEVMLDEAKYEIVCLRKTIEKSKTDAEDMRAEWDAKEISLRAAIEKADEEITSIKVERDQAMEKLQRKKIHGKVVVEEANKLHLKKRQAKVSYKKKGENDKEHNIMHSMIVVMADNGNSEVTSEEAWELIKDDRKVEENGGEGDHVKVEAKFDDCNLVQLNGLYVQDGRICRIKHQLLQRKKKDLLNKMGDFLKKKGAPKW